MVATKYERKQATTKRCKTSNKYLSCCRQNTKTDTQTHRQIETDRQRQGDKTETETDRQTDRDRDGQTDRQREEKREACRKNNQDKNKQTKNK